VPAAKMRAQSSTRTHHDDVDEFVCLSSDEVHASSDESAAQTPAAGRRLLLQRRNNRPVSCIQRCPGRSSFLEDGPSSCPGRLSQTSERERREILQLI
jgi:hypothetical protein